MRVVITGGGIIEQHDTYYRCLWRGVDPDAEGMYDLHVIVNRNWCVQGGSSLTQEPMRGILIEPVRPLEVSAVLNIV